MIKKKASKIETVALDKLLIDHDYQRLLNDKFVQDAVKDYNPMLIGVLEVSKRPDGTYFVLDGQHRVAVMLASGEAVATCNVHTGLDRQQEAWFFRYYNKKRRTITAFEDWNASVFEGDERTMVIKKTVEARDLRVAGFSSPQTISAIWTLRQLDKMGRNDDLLGRVLDLAVGSWRGEDSAFEGEVLMGVAAVVRKYGDRLSDRRAIQKWEKDWTPRRLLGAASDRKYTLGMSKTKGITEFLVYSYDKGLRNKLNQPEPDELVVAVA